MINSKTYPADLKIKNPRSSNSSSISKENSEDFSDIPDEKVPVTAAIISRYDPKSYNFTIENKLGNFSPSKDNSRGQGIL